MDYNLTNKVNLSQIGTEHAEAAKTQIKEGLTKIDTAINQLQEKMGVPGGILGSLRSKWISNKTVENPKVKYSTGKYQKEIKEDQKSELKLLKEIRTDLKKAKTSVDLQKIQENFVFLNIIKNKETPTNEINAIFDHISLARSLTNKAATEAQAIIKLATRKNENAKTEAKTNGLITKLFSKKTEKSEKPSEPTQKEIDQNKAAIEKGLRDYWTSAIAIKRNLEPLVTNLKTESSKCLIIGHKLENTIQKIKKEQPLTQVKLNLINELQNEVAALNLKREILLTQASRNENILNQYTKLAASKNVEDVRDFFTNRLEEAMVIPDGHDSKDTAAWVTKTNVELKRLQEGLKEMLKDEILIGINPLALQEDAKLNEEKIYKALERLHSIGLAYVRNSPSMPALKLTDEEITLQKTLLNRGTFTKNLVTSSLKDLKQEDLIKSFGDIPNPRTASKAEVDQWVKEKEIEAQKGEKMLKAHIAKAKGTKGTKGT